MGLSSALTSVIDVHGRKIHLSVRHEAADVWRWRVLSEDSLTLEQGVMTTRLAAQVAAQCAFEYRLRRAGGYPRDFVGYRWNEVV